MKFYYCELQNRHSYCRATELQASNLADAMKEAENERVFCGTVLQIGSSLDHNGFLKKIDAMQDYGENWEIIEDEVEDDF